MIKVNSNLNLGPALFLLLFVSAAVFSASDRPSTYGFAPAMPLSTQLPPFETLVPTTMHERTVDLTLMIDETGKVKGAVAEKAADSQFAGYVLSSVEKIPFEPALKSGAKISSRLPIRFSYNPRYRSAKVEYAVDSMLNVASNYLYYRALELNGITLPKVMMFPSYFFKVSRADSLKILPYVLLKIKLDENGKLIESEMHESTMPAHTDQISSAALWGEYTPLLIEGKMSPCICYLLVSLLPQIQYPTKPVNFETDTMLQWYDHWRVRILPDTIGLVHPALPTVQKIDVLPLVGTEKLEFAGISAILVVDSVGNAAVGLTDTKKAELNKAVRSMLKNTRFFPATDFSGKHVGFRGAARINFESRANARIEYRWLND